MQRVFESLRGEREKFDIGIFQSSMESSRFPVRYQRAVESLQKNFSAKIRDYTIYSREIPSDHEIEILAQWFHQAVQENDMLLSLTGGYTSNCLLPHLDYDLIKKRKPVIIGYSDTTALLLGIYARTNLPVIYGPAVLGSFGNWPEIHPYTIDSLRQVLMKKSENYRYSVPESFSETYYFWDKEDRQAMHFMKNTGWRVNTSDISEGILIGGNLDTFRILNFTGFCPALENCILFLEDAFTSKYKFYRDIESLIQQGVFQKVSGVLLGKFFQSGTERDYEQMQLYLLERMKELNVPAMTNVDFGHCTPAMSLPLGVKARIDFGKGNIELLESFQEVHNRV